MGRMLPSSLPRGGPRRVMPPRFKRPKREKGREYWTDYHILSGLSDSAYDKCKATVAGYGPDYSFAGSQYQLSVPAYLPIAKTLPQATAQVVAYLTGNGLYGVSVSHPGGYTEGTLTIRATTSVDNQSQADVQGVFMGAANDGFYLRSGTGGFNRTYQPDPCAGKGGEEGTPGGSGGGAAPGKGIFDDLLTGLTNLGTPAMIALGAVAVWIVGGALSKR